MSSSSSLAPFFGSSALRSTAVAAASSLLRPLLTSRRLSSPRSPRRSSEKGKVQNLSPRAVWLYLMRLDDPWASLLGASLPPAPGLTASSCSYGREFATRFFPLPLAATPCVSLRLPSSAPIGSFHPIRFCTCWAHSRAVQGDRPTCACCRSNYLGRAHTQLQVFQLFAALQPRSAGHPALNQQGSMNVGRTVFAQLMDHIPPHEFHQCAERYQENYKWRQFSWFDQYLCLAFGQLRNRESLRDIEACLRSECAMLSSFERVATPDRLG